MRRICGSIIVSSVVGWAGLAFAQATNQITEITPASAAQGTSNVVVAFALDTDSPPAPPVGVLPNSVVMGTLTGSSVTHTSQHVVTAVFTIPAGEAAGAKDASITFTTPNGTLVFSKAAAFTVTTGEDAAPTITQQPASQTAYAGSAVTLTVGASGTPPLAYQWQKNGADIDGAESATCWISPVTQAHAGAYRCVVTNAHGSAISNAAVLTVSAPPTNSFPVVDTGQHVCYNATIAITCPSSGQAFQGQDAPHMGYQPSYTLSGDGLTVYDNVTGLTWQRSPDTNGDGSITSTDKLTWTAAQARPAALNAAGYGGYSDWRLPTIKELYSLIDFSGTDPSGYSGTDTSGLRPFINTSYFRFAYGQTSAGERIIDSQYASRTLYVSTAFEQSLFGVNFADGRIKGYGLVVGGTSKTFFVQCVRGNPEYGINNFVENGDGTVTDLATGLMWTQADSGSGMNWEDALAWAQAKNAETHLGHSDWRLPNAKELQSIVDYTRSPDTSASAAIDAVFSCTAITGEKGQVDYPWYWSSTTHAAYSGSAVSAAYVCFGRATGYMNGTWVDVHGAGCQRSDPKSGNLASYSYAPYGYYHPQAPQGDAIRISNYVRLVRTPYCPGDLNHDHAVDADDVTAFIACATGPCVPSTDPACSAADFDGDSDVDQDDFGFLQARFGSSGLPCK